MNHYFSISQFGFTKGKSTDTALFKHLMEIAESVEKNNFAVGVYLDLAKAFDTVGHNRLLHKLKSVGIGGPLLDWFKSYLTDRKPTS